MKVQNRENRKIVPIPFTEAGWGMMEIIVGILLAAIVGFISLHLINLGLAMYKLNAGAKGVAEKLETAKQMAVNQNKEVTVLFDSKENIFGIDRNGNGKLENAEAEDMPDGVTLSQDGQVIFSRAGRLMKDSKEPSIVIRNTRDSRRVSVSSMGAIEID
jgi:Tfp pilus assembly protein FimT